MGASEHAPIRRIGVVVKPDEPRAREVIASVLDWAAERGIEVLAYAREPWSADGGRVHLVPAEELAERADLVLAFGGDGTMIGTARLVRARPIPVVGINFGTLGFLTEFTAAGLFPALEAALEGRLEVERRVTIDCAVERGGETVFSEVALNDVVVNKSALARIIELDCWVDGRYVTDYRADGLIVSTPTGSTAYNLSAGGPILMPELGAFILNPICPHTLSNRPLVVADSVTIDLNLRTRDESVMITVDGQIGFDMREGDRVRVRKSATTFDVARPSDQDYFRVLRDKLRWGGQIPVPTCD